MLDETRGEELLLEENLVIEMLFGLFTTVLFHRARFSTQQRRCCPDTNTFRTSESSSTFVEGGKETDPSISEGAIFLFKVSFPRYCATGKKEGKFFQRRLSPFHEKKKNNTRFNKYLYIREKMSILTYYMYITLRSI